MAAARLRDMPTTQTTATIPSSGKKVWILNMLLLNIADQVVCVSDALVAEIKRIVKESEILKYACFSHGGILN